VSMHALHGAIGYACDRTARQRVLLQKHAAECTICLTHTFLRPVLIYPGFFVLMAFPLCLTCRVSWRDSHSANLASTFEHHQRAETRQAHAEQEQMRAIYMGER
jgi:hypothetical protein